MKHLRLASAIASMSLVLAACGRTDTPSSVEYSPLSPDFAGLMSKIRNPTIKICVNGMTATEQWGTWTHDSVLKWIAPLQKLTSTKLASDVTFIQADDAAACAAADAQVNLYGSYFRAYTQVGPRPVVNVSRQDARSGHVILHELGHAFGMGDTYYGSDTYEQPDSVMKTANFSDLQPDDIAGITYLFNRMFFPSKARQSQQQRFSPYMLRSFDAYAQVRANVESHSRTSPATQSAIGDAALDARESALLTGCLQP